MKTSIAAVLAASAFAVPAAHAEFSLQADVGGSKFSKSLCQGADPCDRRGGFDRLLAGYHFDNGLGIEIGRVDYGTVYVASDNWMWGVLKSTAVTAGVSYRRPVWRTLGVVARGGVSWQKAELMNPVFGPFSRTSAQPYAGLGLTVAIKPYWGVELGADVSRARQFDLYVDDKRTLSAWYFGTRVNF
ncbi:outer membrane beta-barrel protein [Roseateles sp. L2-2]|uniref:outer membrane beta-barrel protein n=1 Tax=Roseateles TaxID=93681 RepID=UPI003D3637A3